MRPSLSLKWKIVSSLGLEFRSVTANTLFKSYPDIGLYKRQLRIPLNLCYVANRLSPGIKYHKLVKSLLEESFGIRLANKGFPYIMPLPEAQPDQGSIQLFISDIRLYPPGIAALTLEVKGIPCFSDVNKLIDYQRLPRTAVFEHIIRYTLGLIMYHGQGDTIYFKGNFDAVPFIHIDNVCSEEEFDHYFNSHLTHYIGILIRNRHYKYMGITVLENIIRKNANINVKSSEQLLIDKQGILYLTPTTLGKVHSRSQVHNLCEISLVMEQFLRKYQEFRKIKPNFADFILYKVMRWIEHPETVIIKSVSNQAIWSLMLLEYIKSANKYTSNKNLLSILDNKSMVLESIGYDWWNDPDTEGSITNKLAGENVSHSMTTGKVFVSYSHTDVEWLNKLKLICHPYIKKGIMDLWDDSRIKPGKIWREEISRALNSSKVAILLVSANFLASDFIVDHELPVLLSNAKKKGTIILPLILRPCLYSDSELEPFQSVNSPFEPLSGMTEHAQEQVFVKVATAIKEAIASTTTRFSNPMP